MVFVMSSNTGHREKFLEEEQSHHIPPDTGRQKILGQFSIALNCAVTTYYTPVKVSSLFTMP